MNKFDERYEIRLACTSDIPYIMKFIDEYWRKGHIMGHDRMLFEYEYVDGDDVNFILAIDRNTGSIEGIFGFLNCSRTKDSSKKDIWGSMWKVVENHNNIPLLGVELARRAYPLTGCRSHIGNGANPGTTVPLRRMFFREKVGKMQHYYILNSDLDNYRIALIQEKSHPHSIVSHSTKLVQFHSIQELKKNFDIENIDAIPYKDNWYLNKRYFNHPYYTYTVYGLQKEAGLTGALMMTREVCHDGGKVLRIVDYAGDQSLFAGLGSEFERLLQTQGYEYIDFYTLGFDGAYILEAGFRLKTEDDPNIIPNYFEPFVRQNSDIWAHYKLDGTLFFKADGDQDRPNQPVTTND